MSEIKIEKHISRADTVRFQIRPDGIATLELKPDGTAYVNGELVAVDKTVYLAMRTWLYSSVGSIQAAEFAASGALSIALRQLLHMEDNLKATQARSTELIQESRALARKVEGLEAEIKILKQGAVTTKISVAQPPSPEEIASSFKESLNDFGKKDPGVF